MPPENPPASFAVAVSRESPAGPAWPSPVAEHLLLLTGHAGIAGVLWVTLLKWQGHATSVSIVLAFLALSALAMAGFLRTRRLVPFAHFQLALVLFAPFCAQWAAGSFVTTGGLSLWALLAPAGAAVVLGPRRWLPWGAAWLALTVSSAVADYLAAGPQARVDLQTVGALFAINLAGVGLLSASLAGCVASRETHAGG